MLYTLSDLFAKLGLPHSPQAIGEFIARHHPLPQAEPLAGAAFWNAEQADFLRQARESGSDWAEVVDELNSLLRD